jgi:hypothetical protein
VNRANESQPVVEAVVGMCEDSCIACRCRERLAPRCESLAFGYAAVLKIRTDRLNIASAPRRPRLAATPSRPHPQRALAPEASAIGRAQGPIDTSRPFELELFCVPAEEDCSDALLPFGCGLYGSVDAETIDAFRHVCDTPGRRLITRALYDGGGSADGHFGDECQDEYGNEGLQIAQAFGFIRAREDEPFPIGTLAIANELRIGGFDGIVGQADRRDGPEGQNPPRVTGGRSSVQSPLAPLSTGGGTFELPSAPAIFSSSPFSPPCSAQGLSASAWGTGVTGSRHSSHGPDQRKTGQLEPALFSYYGLARFQLLDLLDTPSSSPYPIGLVQLFYDHEPESPASMLLELETKLVRKMRDFLSLSSMLALASDDEDTASLYKDRLGELDALLAECRRGPTRLDSRWGKRHELVSFFVCDHLSLPPDERTRLIRLRDSEERLRFALEQMGPMVAELAALSSLAKALPSTNLNS